VRVLIACEFSAAVRDAFRARGHDARSVDIIPTEGDPRWHIQGDALETIERGRWDLMVAFPPCTHLASSGSQWWPAKRADGRQHAAFAFVRSLWEAPVPRVAIENPAGWLNTNWRRPDQIVNPWQFGDPWNKRTCLWVRGLPLLAPTDVVESNGPWVGGEPGLLRSSGGAHRNPHERSRTFQGIANAMAEQWGNAI
jgi:site-specific DNA-cytosine methylase